MVAIEIFCVFLFLFEWKIEIRFRTKPWQIDGRSWFKAISCRNQPSDLRHVGCLQYPDANTPTMTIQPSIRRERQRSRLIVDQTHIISKFPVTTQFRWPGVFRLVPIEALNFDPIETLNFDHRSSWLQLVGAPNSNSSEHLTLIPYSPTVWLDHCWFSHGLVEDLTLGCVGERA